MTLARRDRGYTKRIYRQPFLKRYTLLSKNAQNNGYHFTAGVNLRYKLLEKGMRFRKQGMFVVRFSLFYVPPIIERYIF